MAIIGINDIRAEYDTVFEFINECQRRDTEKEYTAEFLRPTERDDGLGDKIILMSNPSRITEHNVLDTRIYVVNDTTDLKRKLFKYRVQQ